MEEVAVVPTEIDEKTGLTPEQEREVVEAFYDGKEAPEFLDKEPDTSAPQTPETPYPIQTAAPVQQSTTDQTAPETVDVESLKRQLETFKQRYDHASRKIAEQGQELGRYRTQPPPAPAYQPPPYIPHVPPPIQPDQQYDFTDPNSVAKVAQNVFDRMEQERAAHEQAQRQHQFVQNWNGNVYANKQRLSVDRQVPETVIDDAISRFNQDVMEGKVPDIAFVWTNLTTLMQEAETRGEQKAMARLQAAQNQPKRAAAATSHTATASGKNVKEMSLEELQAEVKTLPAQSHRLQEIAELLMRG